MGRRLGKVKPGQSDKSQGVKRTGAGAEKAIVKPYATAGDQRKRQTVKPTLPVGFAQFRHQQEIKADANHQQRQDLLKNIGLHVLHQQRSGG